jgi:hypothetical protein
MARVLRARQRDVEHAEAFLLVFFEHLLQGLCASARELGHAQAGGRVVG